MQNRWSCEAAQAKMGCVTTSATSMRWTSSFDHLSPRRLGNLIEEILMQSVNLNTDSAKFEDKEVHEIRECSSQVVASLKQTAHPREPVLWTQGVQDW